jgi:hypothetical protein
MTGVAGWEVGVASREATSSKVWCDPAKRKECGKKKLVGPKFEFF